MHDIRNIRWIDHKPGARLSPTPQEGDEMKGQKGYAIAHGLSYPGVSPSALVRALWLQLKRWRQLAEQRRRLAGLSDEALSDLGLSRADVLLESERPFWDDPLAKSAGHHERSRR
jgi:uncharacterized protein YjiS (DUF1127 family)